MTDFERSSESFLFFFGSPSELAWPSIEIFFTWGFFLITSAMSWRSEKLSSLITALLTSNWIFSLKTILLSRSSTRGGGFGTSGGGGATTTGAGGGGGVPEI